MKRLIFLITLSFALLPLFVYSDSGNTTHSSEFNYSVQVNNPSDLINPYIFNWTQDFNFNVHNGSSATSAEMICDDWINGCLTPILIQNETYLTLNFLVPNTTLPGIYTRNISFSPFNSSNSSVLSEGIFPNPISLTFNVTYFFNFSLGNQTSNLTTNQTNQTNTSTITEYNVSTVSNGQYTYLQNELPTNFIELVTLFGSNHTNLDVNYDSWLSGPTKLNLTGSILESQIQVNIPKVAVGTYYRRVYYYNSILNLTKNHTIKIRVRPPEYDHTQLENWENLDDEARLKFAITFLDSYYQKILVNLSNGGGKVPELIKKYQVTPVNYEFLSDLFEKAKQADPKMIQKYEMLSKTASSLNKSYASSLNSCNSHLTISLDENNNLRKRNLELASIHDNDSIMISFFQNQLKGYDKHHVRNSTFWVPMSMVIGLALFFSFKWGKYWYEEYSDL